MRRHATRLAMQARQTLPEGTGVVGAAKMVLDELFAPERVAVWIGDGLTSGRPHIATY